MVSDSLESFATVTYIVATLNIDARDRNLNDLFKWILVSIWRVIYGNSNKTYALEKLRWIVF